ncbi:putative E3 ubiquitin-protein ligase HERC1, partial [Exaiptasia diaphana]
AKQRQQLQTIFALGNKLQPADISLAVTSYLPSILYGMCSHGLTAAQPSPYQTTQSNGKSMLPVILQVASSRLLQIIAVTVGNKRRNSVFDTLIKTRGMWGEHERSVGNHDA